MGEGAAKRCAGLASSSVGEIRGEPTTQAGAPFALGADARDRPDASCSRDPRLEASCLVARRPAGTLVGCGPRPLRGRRRARSCQTESQIRDSPGASRTDLVSFIPLRLPVSPVQLRPDARRPHLRAGHRGRGRHPPAPADPARAGGLHGLRGHRGPRRGAPVPPEPPRHRHSRRGAPRPRRLAGPGADPGHERHPRSHADRPGHRAGQGAGPQCRGRRLPDQAVQPGRAVGPPRGHQPPPGVHGATR